VRRKKDSLLPSLGWGVVLSGLSGVEGGPLGFLVGGLGALCSLWAVVGRDGGRRLSGGFLVWRGSGGGGIYKGFLGWVGA